jgi:membrane dipeptidase
MLKVVALPVWFTALALAAQPPLPPAPAGYDAELWRRAWQLHHSALVVDTHSDTTTRILDEGFDIGPRATSGHMDLVRIGEGGLDAQFYSIYVAAKYYGEETFERRRGERGTPNGSARRALAMIDGLLRSVARYPEKMVLCTTVADVERAQREGRHAALMGIEGGHAIEGELALLRMFHVLGVRYMTLTHTNHNEFADSCAETPPRWNGLNELGERVVLEMNRLGMIVDVSHVSDATFAAVLRVTRAPVICSHSSCRALCGHARNVTDDMLRALGKNGGVCQINFNCGFVDDDYNKRGEPRRAQVALHRKAIDEKFTEGSKEWREAIEALDRRFPLPEPPPLARLIAHFLHAIRVAGVDHVGIGSDFDGVPCVPRGIDDVTQLPRITYELLRAGIDEAGVRKVLGGNLLRVMRRVEEVAASLAKEPPR